MKKILLILAVVVCMLFTACNMQKSPMYTKESVTKTCGFEEDRTLVYDEDVKGYSCQYLLPRESSVDKHFEYMYFFIFDSEKEAKKAFQATDEWFYNIEEEGSDYRIGWLANVYDADIEQYEYLTGNMIVTVDMQCVSEWPQVLPDPGEDEPIVLESDLVAWEWTSQFRQEVIDMMRRTFS